MEFDLHTCRIVVSKHCKERLLERLHTEEEELIKYVVKTGKVVKKPKKEGSVGLIEKRTKRGVVRIKFRYHANTLYIITVEK